MTAEVFFRYSRRDERFAVRLLSGPQDRGVRVFQDQGDLRAGAEWRRALEAARCRRRC